MVVDPSMILCLMRVDNVVGVYSLLMGGQVKHERLRSHNMNIKDQASIRVNRF